MTHEEIQLALVAEDPHGRDCATNGEIPFPCDCEVPKLIAALDATARGYQRAAVVRCGAPQERRGGVRRLKQSDLGLWGRRDGFSVGEPYRIRPGRRSTDSTSSGWTCSHCEARDCTGECKAEAWVEELKRRVAKLPRDDDGDSILPSADGGFSCLTARNLEALLSALGGAR